MTKKEGCLLDLLSCRLKVLRNCLIFRNKVVYLKFHLYNKVTAVIRHVSICGGHFQTQKSLV